MKLFSANNVRFLLTLGLLSLIFPTRSLPNLLDESRLYAGEDIQNEAEASNDLKKDARSKEEELLAITQEAFRENERLRKEHAKADSNIVTDPAIISGILEESKRNKIKEREEFYKSQKEEPDNPLVDELGTLLPDQEGGYKIDYRFLSEDPFYIPTNVASDIGGYLRRKDYDRVIQYCRKGLNKLQPWSEEYLTLGENRMSGCGMGRDAVITLGDSLSLMNSREIGTPLNLWLPLPMILLKENGRVFVFNTLEKRIQMQRLPGTLNQRIFFLKSA